MFNSFFWLYIQPDQKASHVEEPDSRSHTVASHHQDVAHHHHNPPPAEPMDRDPPSPHPAIANGKSSPGTLATKPPANTGGPSGEGQAVSKKTAPAATKGKYPEITGNK